MTNQELCPGCAAEQVRRYRPGSPDGAPAITSPDAAAEVLVPMIGSMDREHCVVMTLDTRHRLIASTTVSIGSIDHTFMAPREIFRDALLAGASAIFVAHNHPSGDATPSADDRQVTRRLAQAGTTLGIDLLDHLVVGDPGWTSLAREGIL